jgi:hypothetical protein
MRTTRTIENYGDKLCGEAWVRGQRKMSQVMGAFVLLDFTVLWPLGARFETYKMFISLIFIFLGGHDCILKIIWRF